MKVLSKFVFALSLAVATLFCVASTGYCQEKYNLPRGKVVVSVVASEFADLIPKTTEYNPTIAGELTFTLGSVKNFRFSAGGEYKRNFTTEVSTYYGIGRLSYHAGVFEPFVGFGVGIDRGYDVSGDTTNNFSREVSAGADVNAGRLTFRVLKVGWKRTGGFLSPSERTLSSGVGINF